MLFGGVDVMCFLVYSQISVQYRTITTRFIV